MQDRIPLYPGRVKMTPVAGQANTFDMVRADDPIQAGTPLNKATLLKDATAAMFDLGSDAVPDDVLAELGKYKQYWWRRRVPAGNKQQVAAGDWEYLQSSDRSAYPDSGTSGGYEYEYLGIPFDNAVTASKIETGSYVGTGTYGQANPNTLTFGFVPKFVWIYEWFRSDGWHDAGGAAKIPFEIIPEGKFGRKYPPSTDSSPSQNTYSKRVGSTLYWYNTGSDGAQLNYSNSTYYYIAIG